MIVWASRGFVVLVGVWLVGLGVFMLARPRLALAALARLGGSPGVHIGEMMLRLLAGAAFLIASASTRHPTLMSVVGLFLVLSACVILALPRLWHAAYSAWWAKRIPVGGVRAIASISIALGGLVIWVLIQP
ncbi:hypothetical protein [Brevundimonas sp.]|uniref:hypothetical protein n=1 Tax=Brevundimonas sp. TaxID=1871086 RepID=UPI00054EB678|nr:hypothetical protein [Brevundimonas sp.]MBN9464128.1 hypothetical protein [Brevundimonas sp.]